MRNLDKAYVCSKCNFVLPNYSNFCQFCGTKVIKKDFKELPICPKSIKHGHCDDCLKLKAKLCDDCHSDKEVKFRPEYGSKCLCYNCRMNEATFASLQRSC